MISTKDLTRSAGLPLSALVLARVEDAILVNKILESHAFKVTRASDVSVAEELCKKESFDLAVYSTT